MSPSTTRIHRCPAGQLVPAIHSSPVVCQRVHSSFAGELRRGEVSTDYPEMNISTSSQSIAMEHLRGVLHTLSTGAQAGLSSYAMMAYAIVSDVTPPYQPPPELATTPTLADAQAAIDDALAAATTPREMLRIVDAADMLTGATEDAE